MEEQRLVAYNKDKPVRVGISYIPTRNSRRGMFAVVHFTVKSRADTDLAWVRLYDRLIARRTRR